MVTYDKPGATAVPDEERAMLRDLVDEIEALKAERDAVVLAHNYMTPDIFHLVADVRGDSLHLARCASDLDAEVVVMAGVVFMAETVKVLSPDKTVLIPDLRAGCSLASSITPADVAEMRARHPGVPVISYVNTTAAVKAVSDACCTSSNAREVVESFGAPRVMLLPDRFLAANVAATTEVQVIPWEHGACEVHERFTAAELHELRTTYDDDVSIVAHPECPPDVTAAADFVGSTSAMAQWIRGAGPRRVALISECSMADNLAVELPDVEWVRPCNLCPHMKRITLSGIRDSLAFMRHEVTVELHIAEPARAALDRMLEVGR